jgi:septal ring factor EnvC (AmiA/AmiB activator)
MWQQILGLQDCRAVSGSRPTVLHFPSPARKGWSSEERLVELDAWAGRLADPALEPELARALKKAREADIASLDEEATDLRRRLADADIDRALLSGRLDSVDAQLREVDQERASLSDRLDSLHAQLREVDEERARLSAQLTRIRSSPVWRLGSRINRVLRWAARGRAHQGAPEAAEPPHRAPTP